MDGKHKAQIESYGIRFLRFVNTDVRENLDGVCQSIFDNIEKRTRWENTKLVPDLKLLSTSFFRRLIQFWVEEELMQDYRKLLVW